MPSFDILAAFFLATALFAYMPGPALLYTMTQTIAPGKRGGMMAALGLHFGGYVHVIAAAAGLAVVFHAIPILYTVLKLCGAAYLVCLGVRMIWASRHSDTGAHNEIQLTAKKSTKRAFVDSALVEILNPKTARFLGAFLPQVIDRAAGLPIWAQLMIWGTIVNIMFSSADVTCVLLAGTIMARLKKSQGSQRIIKTIGGFVLIGLGARIALSNN